MTGIPLQGPPTPMKPRLYPEKWQSQQMVQSCQKICSYPDFPDPDQTLINQPW